MTPDNWPEELKKKLQGDFYDKLNDAELEYVECGQRYKKGDVEGMFRGLCMQLGSNVSSLLGHSEMDAAIVFPVSMLAAKEWVGTNLKTVLAEIKENA